VLPSFNPVTVAFVAGVWKYTEGLINQLGSPIIKEQFISSDFPIINEVYGKKDTLSNALSKSILSIVEKTTLSL
jgi:hypothetical protein